MERIIAAVAGADLLRALAKKGTESDLTLYNRKQGQDSLTLLFPHRFPESISPMAMAATSAQAGLLQVSELDKAAGEAVLALDAAGLTTGWLHYPYELEERFLAVIKGTALAGWQRLDPEGPDAPALIDQMLSLPPEAPTGPTLIEVDHSFPVRGVGTVALGFLRRGTVERHQELFGSAGNKRIKVRSIQVHDDDQPIAVAPSRVGLALKDTKPEDVPRGTVLSPQAPESVLHIGGAVRRHPSVPIPAEGQRCQLISGFQRIPAKLTMVSDDRWELELETPYALNGRPGIIVRPDAEGPRILAGIATPPPG